MSSDAAIGVGIGVVGLSKVRTTRGGGGGVEECPPPLPRYADHGEYGFYEGGLSRLSRSSPQSPSRSPPQSTLTAASETTAVSSSGDDSTSKMVRSGFGKMHYDSGNYYEGTFHNDVYHGTDCLYVWIDGDDERSSWNEGKRHGNSIYRSYDENGDGMVEYRKYEHGIAMGEGIRWSKGGNVAHRTTNDVKEGGKEGEENGTTSMIEMSLEEAESYSVEKFGLNSPDPSSFLPPNTARVVVAPDDAPNASTTTSRASRTGFFARIFAKRMVGPDGKLMFKDNGTWGTYDGNVNEKGDRLGRGRMTYVDGSDYEGTFVDDKYNCDMGAYRWSDGDEYKGSFKDGERHGVGLFTSASDGTSVYSAYDNGYAVGAGVGFEMDRTKAYGTLDGVRTVDMTIEDAERIVGEKFSSLPSSWSTPTFGTAPSASGVVPTESNAESIPIPETVASPPPPPPTNTKRTGGLGLFANFFSNKKIGPNGEPMFKDHGDWGTYAGEIDVSGNRIGTGKMTYADGGTYEGTFVNDKYHGDTGVYRWSDGDEYSGGWKDGERHGIGIFRFADGSVEYFACEAGVTKGEGVNWSPDRIVAYRTLDGAKTTEMPIDEAEKFARDKFDLPVPEPSASTIVIDGAKAASASSKIGLFARLFLNRKVGPDGKQMFKDQGDWGSYEGDVDDDGNRVGYGKMTYLSGGYYEGDFIVNKFHGDKGLYRWADGEEYEGSWKDGDRQGIGIFRSSDGTVIYSTYDMGAAKGEGLCWSPDRKTVHMTVDGSNKMLILPEEAEEFAREKFSLPVPDPREPTSNLTAAKPTPKKTGLLGSLFSRQKVDSDGKPMFKDYGEWGSYEGVMDENGSRQGNGKMTYVSGSYYEGSFLNDKFHGDKGVYHWHDGDEHEGGWKNGERHGVGIFRSADGTVEYSMHDAGMPRGDGVSWCADRKTAHKTMDGKKTVEILLEEAATLAKDKFGLSVPEPSSTVLVQSAAQPKSSKTGFFARLISNRKVGPDGKRMFKDYGEWGSYEGGVDECGNRQGSGKMTYASGSYYEGNFINDKFHGDKGVYHWLDGDEYEGGWKDGERHGVGIFRSEDGTVEYSTYEMGVAKGDGLYWSSDRKIICKTKGLEKGAEISVSMAEKLAKDMFGLPAPARARLKGELRFEDNGDVGTYEGDTVNGLRQGEGKMLYASGNSYEGDFFNGKFDGNRGSFRWADGTQYEGSWKDGLFNGVGVFRIPGVGVDYSIYKNGYTTGVGVFWNVDYTKAFHTLDGVKMTEISLADAQKLAKAKFGLPTPKRGALPSAGEKMRQKKIGADGKPMFNDYGLWGSYDGDIDVSGERLGIGKMTYVDGGYYEGGFVDDKFYCDKGTYHWFDGDEYEGGWKDGERHGVGIFRKADGFVEYSMYEMGEAKGEGVMWSPDRKITNRTVSGVKKDDISNGMAEKLAKELFDLPVPEPFATFTTNAAAAPVSNKISFFTNFFAKRKVGPDGKPMFKDHGDWGTYEGDVDDDGNRIGKGKMIYISGGYYEGDFVDDKFHCDNGIYRWADGEEYEGSWKDGDRHGIGTFRKVDGIVEISMYDAGAAKGEGVLWSADRKSAFKTVDGNKTVEMTIEEAEEYAREKFGFSMPEPSTTIIAEATAKPYPEPSTPVPTTTPVPTQSAGKQKTGFFASFFLSRKVGPDGKPMFKDHGTWGTYEGDVDDEGNRMGKGKMTYDDGSYYDGGFVNDKFHGDGGVYHWFDGDEYKGSFKYGERHGVGIFRTADGVMIYSIYDAGAAKGSGVGFSDGLETAFETVDGIKTKIISIEDAELLVKEKFDLPTPEPSSTVSSSATTDHSVLS